MEKAPLIEIDQRGILTVLGSETMMIAVLLAATVAPVADLLDMIMKSLMIAGGFGISLTLFTVSATIQEERSRKNLVEKEILRYEPTSGN